MSLADYNWKHIAATAVLVALVAPFIVYAVPQVVGASQGYVVLSDSMSPTIHAGDVVVVDGVTTSQIEKGDVITYDRPGGDDQLVTHRVVEVLQEDGQTKFRTKGDANEEADAQLVPASAVVGVVQFHIPLIGYVIQFGGSDLGTLLLVVVPSVLLIVNEVWSLYRAATPDGSTAEEPDVEASATPEWEWTDEPNVQRGND